MFARAGGLTRATLAIRPACAASAFAGTLLAGVVHTEEALIRGTALNDETTIVTHTVHGDQLRAHNKSTPNYPPFRTTGGTY